MLIYTDIRWGGTNPSLLEALSSTQLNLLYDVGFNREVALETALYWVKQPDSLKKLIEKVNSFSSNKITYYDKASTLRIINKYSWEKITNEYRKCFKREIR